MDGNYVTIEVHKEFEKRVEEENTRQNHRITELEGAVKQISELVSSVKVLAANMENMAKEQAKQGERLEEIEKKPAKRWDVVITGALSAIVGALMAAIMSGMIR